MTRAMNLDRLDETIERMLSVSRIPGAAIAVVSGGQTLLARGYGLRNIESKLPLTSQTSYPIASTTKAMNATLLGMLVDEGRLSWDAPVRDYLPGFRLKTPLLSEQVTLRDLLVMRTGLPRHDFVWLGNPMTRAELVDRLRQLEPCAGFRERFMYNNMTATTAGHVAEIVTGQSWEELVRSRILEPLGMTATGFVMPEEGNVTLSYHENSRREIRPTRRWVTEVTAPSGGAIHSTVEDMARWIAFNLAGGKVEGRALIEPKTLTEIQSPQVAARTDPACPTPHAAYGMGWFIDSYQGHERVSHGGYLNDVNGEVSLHPRDDIGVVSFINFGCPALARSLNQYAFDLMMGFENAHPFDEKLAQYEKKIEEARQRIASVARVAGSSPSHSLDDYVGDYAHPSYGPVRIQRRGDALLFHRDRLVLPLEHWHYDAWVVDDDDSFVIHAPHPFDRASRWLFETNADGAIAALLIPLEPAATPIRFERLAPAPSFAAAR